LEMFHIMTANKSGTAGHKDVHQGIFRHLFIGVAGALGW
jgi:hypothetical protein